MANLQDDASRIVLLMQDYIPQNKTIELFVKLDEEIGKKSDNEITKQFLSILRNVVDKPLPLPPLWLWTAFYALVVLHITLVLGVIASFFVLPFLAPWYVAFPCMTFVWFFSTTKVDCQLTNLENTMRPRLGMKRIGGFVGHYFLRPTRIIWSKRKRRFRSG